MRKGKLGYIFLNVIVILATAVLFILEYRNVGEIFQKVSLPHILILLLAVILVHSVKAGRLYLILYGTEVDFISYLKIYCKTTPVSVVFPFKTGEFFRMYCHGKQQGSLLKGVVIILLDRFMDTFALVTTIFLAWMFNGGHIATLVYVLLAFLAFVLLLYFVFPGVYKFWKKYTLRAKATKHRLAVLKMLDTLDMIYREITNVSVGRGLILYCLSLIAWGVEIGSIAVLCGLSQKGELTQTITDYLMAAMGGAQSVELRQFVFVSVILMVSIYIIVKTVEFMGERRATDDNSNL